ncbi:MAG TPA: phosphoribosylanthranilate isomerase [Candidatus Binataceae bacterium]|nr:phosphoribosylanthranilate isomerase [Candidatus Binataceae bacterium]
MIKVKICGLTRVEDALAACEFGADVIGLNFYDQSPRFSPFEQAVKIRAAIGARARVAGVFVKPARELVAQMMVELKLDMLQIHGAESPELLEGWPVPVLRPLSLRPEESAAGLAPPVGADLVLIDSYDPRLYGGTGRTIPIEHLRKLDLRRCFVAGGLTPQTVGAVAKLAPYGVDVASGVESAPGIKDHLKLRSFIENAKSAG